jgi:5-methylcytosine-specific restriction endonuclease McrA
MAVANRCLRSQIAEHNLLLKIMYPAADNMEHRCTSWEALFKRFGAFQAMPCLRASGPDRNRPAEDLTVQRISRQFERERADLPRRPSDLKQEHFERLLRRRGVSTRAYRKRPTQPALWHGLWRAVILDRDDYRCYFCRRSGESGVVIDGEGCLALRLELDHVNPRSFGGYDYVLDNIRTMCRTCNVARGRMSETHFRAELLSLAAAALSLQRT